MNAFLLDAGALVKVVDAARDHGQIGVYANRTYDCSKAIPGLVIRNEDYGRISRILSDANPVEMEVEIVNTVYEGQLSSNVVAEIPGTDKRSEVVMMGAHIDSWHAATGTTDNAAGVAVIMESARILQKLGLKPRRTIRVALWGGEEQGLLGSKAYINDHFGTFETPKPEFNNLKAYVNLDSGTGRVRGASVFGPPEAASVVREILAPFKDLGVMGANSANDRNHTGTDSTSFNWAGLPGINLSQDPIEYFTHTWHSDLDTYERALEGDLKQCAAVVASLAYHLAMREEMLPRFTGEAMPKQGK
jgi:Zn-dependent M28 family amino/carboxypeptidase